MGTTVEFQGTVRRWREDNVAGGGFCVGVSKAALKSADAAVGDQVLFALEP